MLMARLLLIGLVADNTGLFEAAGGQLVRLARSGAVRLAVGGGPVRGDREASPMRSRSTVSKIQLNGGSAVGRARRAATSGLRFPNLPTARKRALRAEVRG